MQKYLQAEAKSYMWTHLIHASRVPDEDKKYFSIGKLSGLSNCLSFRGSFVWSFFKNEMQYSTPGS